MLVTVAAKFLLLNCAQVLLNFSEMVIGDWVLQTTAFAILVDLSNLLIVLNSATNCLVYFRWSESMTAKKRRGTGTMKSATQQFSGLQGQGGRNSSTHVALSSSFSNFPGNVPFCITMDLTK